MNGSLYGLGSIIMKEFRHIRRDPSTLFFALIIPIVQLTLFGFALDFDVKHVPTVVVDLDRSQESREFIQSVVNTQYIDDAGSVPTVALAQQAIRRNDVHAALIIPSGFARRVESAEPPDVQVLLDGSDVLSVTAARSAFMRPTDARQAGLVNAHVDILYNPDVRTQLFTVPGLMCVLLQLITVALTSFALVREREQGTLEQLMVTPVGRLALVIGKITPYFILGMIEQVFILAMGWLVFDVPVVGSLPLLILMAMPFVIAALAMGLLISTIAQNQTQAMQMTMITTMPAILLSGYVTPRETLPSFLYLLGGLFPVTYFIQISRGIVVRGAGFVDLLPSFLSLVALASIMIALATARFRKSMA